MLGLHWDFIFRLRFALGFGQCETLGDSSFISQFYSRIAVPLLFGVDYQLCPLHIIPPLVSSLSCSFLVDWTIEKIAFHYLLSKVLLQLLSKLEAILQSAIVMGDFNVPLILLLLFTSFRNEEKACTEAYSRKISDGLTVFPEEGVLAVAVAVEILVKLHWDQFE